MTVLNDLDRFHLATDAVDRVPRFAQVGAYFKQFARNKLTEHKEYIYQHGDDMPEIRDWKWPYPRTAAPSEASGTRSTPSG
jgi:xylulose-5-phosphate/fructose-6-phosphate phosphoketolase